MGFKTALILLGSVATVAVGFASLTRAEPKPVPAEVTNREFDSKVVPFLRKYCYDCHGDRRQRGGLDLEVFASADAAKGDRKTWGAVGEYVREKLMPPEGRPQPTDEEERAAVSGWIDDKLLSVDCGEPVSPGRVTLRRLNRLEYESTVRDLFGMDVQLAADFPSDDVGYGFDNIGDVLSMPPILLEKYMSAAEKVVDMAIVNPEEAVASKQLFRPQNLRVYPREARQRGEVAFSQNGVAKLRFTFPAEGEYVFRVRAWGDQAVGELPRMELSLDGDVVRKFDVDAANGKPEIYEEKRRVAAGVKELALAFTNDFYDPAVRDPRKRDRNLFIKDLEIEGPFEAKPAKLPESHRKVITATPGEGLSEEAAARKVIEDFLPKAYRRPARDGEVDRLMRLVSLAAEKGEPFEGRIRLAFRAILCSPHFLFRVELDPKEPDQVRELNDFEFATRLSYFLWASMPDDELFALAGKGTLREPAVLRAQVERMLGDPKADTLVENFAGQWLQLRNLELVAPDEKEFPNFSDALRSDMRRETELFAKRIIKEDRSVLEFIDADWTYLNHLLAEHYGVPGVEGDEFRLVKLPDGRRGGVVTQASVLTITSNPTRTSPVKRGKWVLENLLGTPPPPAPPNVPELEEGSEAMLKGTLRERLEMHRSDAQCASCHKRMDPIGFGLENFDAVGAWREKDGRDAIDPSGVLTDGSKFDGPGELKTVLRAKAGLFRRCLAEKLLTYALGRGLEFYDRCALDGIAEGLETNGDRFSSLVMAIVNSEPFRKRAGKRRE